MGVVTGVVVGDAIESKAGSVLGLADPTARLRQEA
jgi:hypothetical protein